LAQFRAKSPHFGAKSRKKSTLKAQNRAKSPHFGAKLHNLAQNSAKKTAQFRAKVKNCAVFARFCASFC
jgi:hypothetical protein